MNVQKLNYTSRQEFSGKIPAETKKAIKTFTIDYLKKQDGYVSSKVSVFNGLAIAMRGISGTALTGWLIEEMPKLIHDDTVALVAQITTGLGSLAVAASRFENDRAATGQALVKVKTYIEKLKNAGYTKQDEIIFGIKRFMNKKGGFYTSIIPNSFSSKKAEKILEESTIANK